MTDLNSNLSQLFEDQAARDVDDRFVARVTRAVRVRRLLRMLGMTIALLAATAGVVLTALGAVSTWPALSRALGPALGAGGPSLLIAISVLALALGGPRLVRIIRD